MKTRLIFTAVLLAAGTLLAACNQEQGYKDKSAAVATVNGQPITDLEYRHVLRNAKGVAVAANPLERKQVIDQLITGELLAQEARKEKLDQDENVYLTEKFAKQSILARAVVGKYLQEHPVTEQEIKARYDELKNSKEYKISHILLGKEEDAKAVIAELKAGKSFAALAKAKSADVDSAQRGGEIGWIEHGGAAPEIYEAAAKLKNGQVSPEPVKSQYGWHVIRREAERTSKVPPFDKAGPVIGQQLQRERFETYITELRKKAKISIVAQKGESKADDSKAGATTNSKEDKK